MSNTITPEYVYNLVASNPNLRNLVEQAARLKQMQVQTQQFAPMVNQFVQSPLDAAQNYVTWQNQQAAPAPAQQNSPAPLPQEGLGINYAEIAQKAYMEMMNTLNTINGNIKGLYEEFEKNTKRLDDFIKQFEGTSETVKTKEA